MSSQCAASGSSASALFRWSIRASSSNAATDSTSSSRTPVVVEIKSVDRVLPIHQAQLLTYLRLSKLRIGLLVNFRETVLKHGLRRLIYFSELPVFASSCESLRAHPIIRETCETAY